MALKMDFFMGYFENLALKHGVEASGLVD